MFPVKHTVIYTFFGITSVQNTCFCSVFNALASKNPAKSCYAQCFFHFWPFFHCRKATKMTQNSISIPSCAQTPKNPRKMSKHHRILVSVRNRFWAPPAKADIATAILTNVIEHLVLLLPPNNHAFTAKAVWADFPGLGVLNCGGANIHYYLDVSGSRATWKNKKNNGEKNTKKGEKHGTKQQENTEKKKRKKKRDKTPGKKTTGKNTEKNISKIGWRTLLRGGLLIFPGIGRT